MVNTRFGATNTLAGAKRSVNTVVDGDTTAGKFDSAWVSSAIKLPTATEYVEVGAPFGDGSASSATFWLRLDLNSAAGWTGNGNLCAVWYNGAVPVCRLIGNNAGAKMQYYNATAASWNDWNTLASPNNYFVTSANTLYTIAVEVVCGTSMKVYLNGTLVLQNNIAPVNQSAAITKVQLYSGAGIGYVSQIMYSNYDIRDAHMFSKLATANGNDTDGTGTYTDINETVLDETTAISLPVSGNKKTFTKGAIAVPTGMQIGAMVVNGRGRISGAITDGKLAIRSAGTTYASSGRTYNGGYEPRGYVADNDPATSAAWTQTNFNNAEFGAQAA